MRLYPHYFALSVKSWLVVNQLDWIWSCPCGAKGKKWTTGDNALQLWRRHVAYHLGRKPTHDEVKAQQ